MIKKKILAIVYRKKEGRTEILALKENDEDPIEQAVGFYVVTGGVEGDETLTEAVKREINEETGIENIINVQDLNTVYEYKHPAEGDYLCQEHCFAALVDGEVKHLSIEHTEHKWLSVKDFIETVYWYEDKDSLNKLLKQFIELK
mgnify:CR=1 FL=1